MGRRVPKKADNSLAPEYSVLSHPHSPTDSYVHTSPYNARFCCPKLAECRPRPRPRQAPPTYIVNLRNSRLDVSRTSIAKKRARQSSTSLDQNKGLDDER